MARYAYGIKIDKSGLKFGKIDLTQRTVDAFVDKLAERTNDWKAWAAMAGGPNQRFFENGELRLAILSLLDEGPKHGYQLMKEMGERSGGLYRASAGSVYPALQQLEDETLIISERDQGRRVYQLTPLGRAELERDPDAVRRIWDRAECFEDWGQMGPAAMAISGPLATVLKSAVRASQWAAGQDEREDKLRKAIRRFCKDLEEMVKEGS
jgi:DNA-binding PadR family transcriptional regulator